MEVGGGGWRWMEVGGGGMRRVEVDGGGWRLQIRGVQTVGGGVADCPVRADVRML